MFDLTVLDYIYLGAVLASTVWATVRGGVYETVATISWVVAAVAARFVSPLLDGLFQSWFKLSESTIGTLVSSYFLVFFVILVLFGLFNQKLRDKIQESMMKVTDHTLGVIFGIIRGIVLMGLAYWCALWYYSDAHSLPDYVAAARTRPVMQLTAVKLHDWFIPGESKLLDRDMHGTKEAMDIYNNLINPAVKSDSVGADAQKAGAEAKNESEPAAPAAAAPETGYKSSERTALENQLLQIETAARAEEKNHKDL
jgi:membrane protein required for colicin V production